MIALLFYCSVLIFLICLFKLWSSTKVLKSKRKKYINGMVFSALISLFIMSSDLTAFLLLVGFLVFGSCITLILVTGLKNKDRSKKYYFGILISISLLFANSFLASHGINFRINPTDNATTVASEKISDNNLNSNSTTTSKATNTAVKESVENNNNSTPVDNSTNQVSTSNISNNSTNGTSSPSSVSTSSSKNNSSNSSGFSSIKHEDVTTAPTAEQQKSERTVYYTPGGKSFHYNRNCATLKRSKTVLSGKLSDVIRLGKSDPCNVCVRQ
ncbi:hypothetical protein [Clostridium folliculivorans]|uniref:Uncharacterized protein n=1 Tax=Clostridium folliculivorans TaxID=2886038 RepID=A0A9W6DA94_9CLOT|nr:hypothetical protein [Clostridium folliculivorans]GKU25140.1 hypothetical protein CFOLD11_19660 [Clostridium folliculivorans]GKU31238.1 hypothetical protein CFB3_33450 [Clostridium folliculivorans]